MLLRGPGEDASDQPPIEPAVDIRAMGTTRLDLTFRYVPDRLIDERVLQRDATHAQASLERHQALLLPEVEPQLDRSSTSSHCRDHDR